MGGENQLQRSIFAENLNVNIIATKKNGKINAVVTADTVLPERKRFWCSEDYKALRKCF